MDEHPFPTLPRYPTPSLRKSCSSPRPRPPPRPSSLLQVPLAVFESAVAEPHGYLKRQKKL